MLPALRLRWTSVQPTSSPWDEAAGVAVISPPPEVEGGEGDGSPATTDWGATRFVDTSGSTLVGVVPEATTERPNGLESAATVLRSSLQALS